LDRDPREIPAVLAEWILTYGGHDAGARGSMDSLCTAAVQALNQARSRPGRDREAASALLAADALLTAACAMSSEAEDPDAALVRITGEVGDGGG